MKSLYFASSFVNPFDSISMVY